MGSSTRERDFAAFDESNFPGMLVPEHFNNNQDAGDGFPGVQGAMRNWTTWWLHSGNMDSGLNIAGYDITGVNLIYAQDIYQTGDLTGTTDTTISGYDTINSQTGLFTQLGGASDINMQDNILFGDTYHLQGVSQFTGIRGQFSTDVTGTKGLITTANGLTIGSNTPSSAQWGYIAAMNQGVATSIAPTFAGMTLNGALTTSSTIDGVDVSTLNTNYTNHAAAANPHSSSASSAEVDSDIATHVGAEYHDQNTWRTLGTSAGQTCEGNDTRLSNSRTPLSHGYSLHNDINQGLETNDNVTFNSLQCGSYNFNTTIGRIGSDGLFRIYSPTKLEIFPEGTSYYLIMDVSNDDINIYNYGADEATERGQLGAQTSSKKPFLEVYSKWVTSDDGIINSYSHVDDLQLLRETKEWDIRKKVVNPDYPDFKQKVFDIKTLPWIKAMPEVAALSDDDNTRRYKISDGSKIGYLLSTMQKLLERQDDLVSGIETRDNIIENLISRTDILESGV